MDIEFKGLGKLNKAEFARIRKTPELIGEMEGIAETVRAHCAALSETTEAADGYRVGTFRDGKGRAPRARATVTTWGIKARVENRRNNVLLKALKQAGG